MSQADISFTSSPIDGALIRKIAQRARALEVKFAEDGFKPRALIDWQMDLIAVHANGNPLRLDALLAADDFNFGHDVFGISRYLDRDTGKLGDFFSPRFSAQQSQAA